MNEGKFHIYCINNYEDIIARRGPGQPNRETPTQNKEKTTVMADTDHNPASQKGHQCWYQL